MEISFAFKVIQRFENRDLDALKNLNLYNLVFVNNYEMMIWDDCIEVLRE